MKNVRVIKAPNIKMAMQRVQQEMGINAVIYQIKHVMSGIEMVAGNAFDAKINRISSRQNEFQNLFHGSDDQRNANYYNFSYFSDTLARLSFSQDIVHTQSIVALVGLTGVGKTTTIAKMAMRFLEHHHSDEIGIISTDLDETNTKRKLGHFCEINQIEIHHALHPHELSKQINIMSNKRLILIDTHGVSQKDQFGLDNLKKILQQSNMKLSVYLTLSCNQQEEVIEDVVNKFNFKYVSGCILTKIDESMNTIPALNVTVKNSLPIAYICDGQDINKNIIFPNEKNILSVLPMMFKEEDIAPPSSIRSVISKCILSIKKSYFRHYRQF